MARPKTKPSEVRLSPSEWEIMRICWRLGRATVRQILQEDRKKRSRNYRTILTFVSRIARKGYLEVELVGNTNYYTPSLPEDEGVEREVRRFLDQVLGSERRHLEILKRAVEERLSGSRTSSRR